MRHSLRLYMFVLYFSSLTGRLGFHFLFTIMTILAGNVIYSALVMKKCCVKRQ